MFFFGVIWTIDMIDYNKIPKYPRSYYMVNYAVEDIPDMLEKFKKQQETFGYKFILNPDFQRGHVWTQDQQIKYMEHLLMEGSGGRDIYFNHPGWMTHFEADMVCLDGLQRITAILDFLGGLIPVFEQNYIFDFDSQNKHFKIGGLNNKLNIHVLNLKTRKEILFWYLQFNSGGTPHTERELNKVRKMLEEEK